MTSCFVNWIQALLAGGAGQPAIQDLAASWDKVHVAQKHHAVLII